MQNEPLEERPSGLSRRSILALLATVAASPALASRTLASRSSWRRGMRGLTAAQGRPRFLHAAVALADGRLVVIGGYGVGEATLARTGGLPTASVQLYDPSRGAWYDLAPLSVPRARHAAALLPDGRIAVLGGVHTSPLASVEIYDPATNRWEAGEPLSQPMADHAAAVCGGQLVVTGGQNGVPAMHVPIVLAARPSQP